MSGFSFDSSGPPRSSPFQRLVSGRVNRTETAASGDSPNRAVDGRVFNEVGSSPPERREGAEQASGRLVGLEAAVTNLGESRASIDRISAGAREVEGANSDASRALVRDVDAASKLADKLFSQIVGNEGQASDAQVSGISAENVQRVLS